MPPMTPKDQATIIRDLLRIAHVAMPPDLFEQDIRVRRALDLLATLEGAPTGIRVPDHPPKSHAQRMAELRAIGESRDGLSFIIDLPWDLVEALSEGQKTALPTDPSAAVNLIVREWCTQMGYLPDPPEEEN